MPRQQRAKQFAPFEALKGLRDALARKEYEYGRVERAGHSEEMDTEIASEMAKLQRGSKVEVVCYQDGYYVTVVGTVKEINTIFKYLLIEKGKVFFDDIYGLKRI